MDQGLKELLEYPENSQCADCSEPNPTWASTNWGVFICVQCAGVHRSLGVEHSFVLSCSLDNWSKEQIDFMKSRGNKEMNALLEYSVPKTIEVPFGSETDRDTRDKYIRAKYIEQLFCKKEGRTPNPPKRMKRIGSSSSRHSPPSPCLRDAAMIEYIGIIEVELIEGKNLIIKDIISSDPYCKLTVGLQSRKSTIKKKTLNPQYNEMFSFSWDGKDKLRIEIYDHDDLSKDDHMGIVDVDLEFLKKGDGEERSHECWLPVTHRKHRDRQQGELKLKLTYRPIN